MAGDLTAGVSPRGGAGQEEEALLSEMDVTGQAFEDMQEQNLRLLQQLREKDDANFKLMSERIKANQIHKLLREEKDELAEQVLALKAQVDAQLLVVQKLEEKERGLQSSLAAVEKELALRSQALELNKRKVGSGSGGGAPTQGGHPVIWRGGGCHPSVGGDTQVSGRRKLSPGDPERPWRQGGGTLASMRWDFGGVGESRRGDRPPRFWDRGGG
uniref:E3 ubiquitin protein ligase n=1 Tax=Accipiter nisus TaxID=211598 RepID=A0A8B9MPF9_9AVES